MFHYQSPTELLFFVFKFPPSFVFPFQFLLFVCYIDFLNKTKLKRRATTSFCVSLSRSFCATKIMILCLLLLLLAQQENIGRCFSNSYNDAPAQYHTQREFKLFINIKTRMNPSEENSKTKLDTIHMCKISKKHSRRNFLSFALNSRWKWFHYAALRFWWNSCRQQCFPIVI